MTWFHLKEQKLVFREWQLVDGLFSFFLTSSLITYVYFRFVTLVSQSIGRIMTEKQLDRCKKYLRSTLLSNKGGIPAAEVYRHYKDLVGEEIPYS